MMKILITGGTGFFGKALLRHWSGESEIGKTVPEISVLSRDPETFKKNYPELTKNNWINFIKGDILVPESIINGKYSHIIHGATDSTNSSKLTKLERYKQIVNGTQNMLDYAIKNKIKRFLLTSSGGVYGEQPKELNKIEETFNGKPDTLNPNNVYSIAKISAEHLCTIYQATYNLETVIARCFTFVGRDLPLKEHYAIGNFINDAITNNEIIIQGDGTPIRTYMDQRDLARWIIKILEYGKSGNAYNVGSEEKVSLNELALVVRNTIAKNSKIIKKNNKESNRIKYVPSVKKAKTELNLEIEYNLKESLLEIVRHTKKI